jgi:hypothetical protein
MKRFEGKKKICWMAIVIGVAVLALVSGKAAVQEEGPLQAIAPQIPLPVDKGDPKMEYALYMFQKIFYTEGLDKAKEFAQHYHMDLEENRIRVVVETDASLIAAQANGLVNALTDHIQTLGGKVEMQYNNLIQSQIPLTGLLELTANPTVKYIRLPLKPTQLQVTSEGVDLTGANLWQSLYPYRNPSSDLKVCILDLGFKNYAGLLGTELPASLTTRSFRADNDISANQVHGTACAEIVFDMMPNAQFYLANFSTDVEQHIAVDWIISEGVDVISYSIAWYNAGDGAGTGPICEDVEKATNGGIVWVGAAGNDAQNHWTDTFGDPNNNGFHNFIPADEILQVYVPALTPVAFFLNWDDWGYWNGFYYSGSNQDYDLGLYIWWGGVWTFVTASENWQTGTQWPVEFTGDWYSNVSTYWGVAIRKYSATRNCKMELFTYGNSGACEYNVPEGSLTIPADSPDCIAVGAIDAVNDTYHSYSSRGPTHDGRIKPDFCAPSGVSSTTYGSRASGGFYGTSAATPHMAGGIILMKGTTPYSLSQVRTILEKRAIDMGSSGKDNQYGIGRLNLKR